MYKKTLCALLAGSMAAAALGGCSLVDHDTTTAVDTSGTSSAEDSNTVSDTASWEDLEFTFDGQELTMGFSFSTLLDMGWEINYDDEDMDGALEEGAEYTLPAGVWIYDDIALCKTAYENVYMWVSVYNPSADEECALYDSCVYFVDIQTDFAAGDIPELELAGGITWGSTISQIESTYGSRPDETNYSSELEYYNYAYESSRNGETDYLAMDIYTDDTVGMREMYFLAYSVTTSAETEGYLSDLISSSSSSTDIDTDTYTDSDSDKEESSEASSNASSAASSASAASNTTSSGSWEDLTFTLDGKQFSLMFDYSELASAGWEYDISEDYPMDIYSTQASIFTACFMLLTMIPT